MNAFLFPGQGSQYAGMGKEIAENFSIAMQTFAEADEALGIHLRKLCFEGPDEELKLTANTQPAILAASIAVYRVIQQETGISAAYMAGHSLGEFTALVAAGALTFADAVRVVRARGLYMQEAVPIGTGAMAAILGVERDELSDICNQAAKGEVVSPANFNSPGQIVIAGNSLAVNRAIEIAKARGYRKAMLLPVSAPFHCSLMQPAADRLKMNLVDLSLQPLQVPVVTNVEAEPNSDITLVKNLLVQQVCAPVRWHESVLKMHSLGVNNFIEIGPGKVLTGLVKRIVKDSSTSNVEDVLSLKTIMSTG